MTGGRATTVMCKIRGDMVTGRTTDDVARDTTVDEEIPRMTDHAEETPMLAVVVVEVAITTGEFDRLVYGRKVPWSQKFYPFFLESAGVRGVVLRMAQKEIEARPCPCSLRMLMIHGLIYG
jgi:hypothetical protein